MGSATLRIRLLGELDLRLNGRPLRPLESARAESLLAFLLLHREAPQSRQRLAFLLWPDSTEPQARTNLRHVLHNLRRALPDLDRFLQVTPRTLQWRPDAPFWLDVAAFQALLARAAGDADGGLAALREAVELYRGDLLEGSHDDWLLEQRERLRQGHRQALERLTELLAARGDHGEAIVHAERLLQQDPLDEQTYRVLMGLHDARGDRARALRTYHTCAAVLERELAVEPSAPTRRLYEALLPPGSAAPASREAGPAGPLAGAPLVGRASEWARLTGLWRAVEAEGARLVLVTGEPGVGKTRLVEELRSWCAHRGAVTAAVCSYPAEGALAYEPVVSWLRVEALSGQLQRLDRAVLGELARLLPELRSDLPDLPGPQPLPDSDRRQRLFDALARALLASGRPLLLVADDLHWADRETLRFLHYLLRVRPRAPLLVAATARREEIDHAHHMNDLVTGLRGLERLVEVELGRLSREQTGALAELDEGGPGGPRRAGGTGGRGAAVAGARRRDPAVRAGHHRRHHQPHRHRRPHPRRRPRPPHAQARPDRRQPARGRPGHRRGRAAARGRRGRPGAAVGAPRRRRQLRHRHRPGVPAAPGGPAGAGRAGVLATRPGAAGAAVPARLRPRRPRRVGDHHGDDARPPLPFLPPEQVGKPVLGLVLAWAGDPDATAAGEREVGVDLSFAAAWPPTDPDPGRHLAWVRRGWEALRPHSVGVYVNFVSDEGAAGVQAAYGTRLARLAALKDRYDPDNVFRLNANIRPSRPGSR